MDKDFKNIGMGIDATDEEADPVFKEAVAEFEKKIGAKNILILVDRTPPKEKPKDLDEELKDLDNPPQRKVQGVVKGSFRTLVDMTYTAMSIHEDWARIFFHASTRFSIEGFIKERFKHTQGFEGKKYEV